MTLVAIHPQIPIKTPLKALSCPNIHGEGLLSFAGPPKAQRPLQLLATDSLPGRA